MPGKPEFSRAALDRGDNLVGDVLVDVEAFGLHGGSPCFAGRAMRPHGGKETGPISRAIKRRACAPHSGAELHEQSEEASRVDRTAGSVNVPG